MPCWSSVLLSNGERRRRRCKPSCLFRGDTELCELQTAVQRWRKFINVQRICHAKSTRCSVLTPVIILLFCSFAF